VRPLVGDRTTPDVGDPVDPEDVDDPVDSEDGGVGATTGAAKVAPAPIRAAATGTITAWTKTRDARRCGDRDHGGDLGGETSFMFH
jgi:hypothetical protein